MKQLLFLLLLTGSCRLWSQSISPQVINASGGTRSASNGITITDNVGEPFSTAVRGNNLLITEGYLQPVVNAPGFNVLLRKSDLTCSDSRDGKISLAVTTGYKYSATYAWTPVSACPGNNCSMVDSLNTGTYTVNIRFTYTTSAGLIKLDSSVKVVTLTAPSGPCKIHPPSAFTPNGDGLNDTWIIRDINIPEYNSNKVSIFNRWGEEVYSVNGYNNSSKVWGQSGDKLIPSTYFYIIDLGDGSQPIKGWVEVMSN